MKAARWPADWAAFFIVFAYVIITGFLVQFVILPYLAPGLHDGDGMLRGLDTTGFHREAVELARRIHVEGWSAWSFRPDGFNSPPGLMSFVYALTWPKPVVLLPISAFLWGLAAFAMVRILQMLFPSIGRLAIVGALLMACLPSTFMWTTQFHKDVFSIPGTSLVMLGFFRSSMFKAGEPFLRTMLPALCAVICGAFLIWIVRPYLLNLMMPACLLALCVLLLGNFLRSVGLRQIIGPAIIAVAVIVIALGANRLAGGGSSSRMDVTAQISEISIASRIDDSKTAGASTSPVTSTEVVATAPEPSDNLLIATANKLANIVLVFRAGYCSGQNLLAGAMIDCDVKVKSASDAIIYLPRALQVALLAPFPHHWISDGKSPGGSLMRIVVGGEMALNYLIFLAAILVLVLRKTEFTIRMAACLVFLIAPALIIVYSNPNLGTIYRMRYLFLEGPVAIAACIAIAGIIHWRNAGGDAKAPSEKARMG